LRRRRKRGNGKQKKHLKEEKSHHARDSSLSASMKAYIKILCNKLKLHHQSLGTYNTVEAIKERRRVCVDLGILRQQD